MEGGRKDGGIEVGERRGGKRGSVIEIRWVRGRDRGRVEERGIMRRGGGRIREWWRRSERWCEGGGGRSVDL